MQGGIMLSRHVSPEDAVFLLDAKGTAELDEAVASGAVKPQKGSGAERFRVADLVMLKLAQTIRSLGVGPEKAVRYSEAILASGLENRDRHALEWLENESEDLFCLLEDNQLARIFVRNKEDAKEVDVGAVKPVLFPTIRCEVNVFRVIRPVIYRARRLLSKK
jgi:hypothetical protein